MRFRSIVITGASRGLGAALARRYAAPGVVLGLIGRDAAALEAVALDCAARGALPRLAVQDVRDAAGMDALLREWDAAEPVDLAIANAGIAAGTRPDGAAEGLRALTAQVEVNLLGAAHLVEPLLPGMRARGRGAIGLVTSLAALRGLPDSPGYCASKAGLWAWGEALRGRLRAEGVQVTLLAPGYFNSAMGDRYVGARPFSMSAEVAAARVARALDREAAQAVFPWPLALALRLAPFLPARVVDRVVGKMAFRVREQE
ncbi:SDR family NAD(P)-dependent oxidoreductase [Pseudoroseomonas globiformis]|uniref:SDR family NAD(P)-dependent oxidoreductase n=1 Tax=Teichococcus globiformis TaxID=2307229 RepID=A0ABV7G1S5_9PROT